MTSELLQSSSLSLPPDSYIYSVIPVADNAAIAAISSDDSLRIFDPTTLQLTSNYASGKVHEGVTCLKNLDADAGILVTVGRDATVRCWDPRTGLQSIGFTHGPNAPYLALACKGPRVAVGTELTQSQATVLTWDYRLPKEPLVQYVECHNDDVTELQFHPTNYSFLLSGSTDGLVNVLDITVADEDDALVQITNHGSSIHRGGFLSKNELYALSHDETFSIYQFDASDEAETSTHPHLFGDLRSQLDCDYVVDVVFSGNRMSIIGAGSHRKQHLDLVPLRFASEWVLGRDQPIRLPGAHGAEIVRSICFDHSEQTIFTGGEDGLIKAWRVPGADATNVPAFQQSKDVKKPKNKEASESNKARFKPY